jgi:hypothetical protein
MGLVEKLRIKSSRAKRSDLKVISCRAYRYEKYILIFNIQIAMSPSGLLAMTTIGVFQHSPCRALTDISKYHNDIFIIPIKVGE